MPCSPDDKKKKMNERINELSSHLPVGNDNSIVTRSKTMGRDDLKMDNRVEDDCDKDSAGWPTTAPSNSKVVIPNHTKDRENDANATSAAASSMIRLAQPNRRNHHQKKQKDRPPEEEISENSKKRPKSLPSDDSSSPTCGNNKEDSNIHEGGDGVRMTSEGRSYNNRSNVIDKKWTFLNYDVETGETEDIKEEEKNEEGPRKKIRHRLLLNNDIDHDDMPTKAVEPGPNETTTGRLPAAAEMTTLNGRRQEPKVISSLRSNHADSSMVLDGIKLDRHRMEYASKEKDVAPPQSKSVRSKRLKPDSTTCGLQYTTDNTSLNGKTTIFELEINECKNRLNGITETLLKENGKLKGKIDMLRQTILRFNDEKIEQQQTIKHHEAQSRCSNTLPSSSSSSMALMEENKSLLREVKRMRQKEHGFLRKLEQSQQTIEQMKIEHQITILQQKLSISKLRYGQHGQQENNNRIVESGRKIAPTIGAATKDKVPAATSPPTMLQLSKSTRGIPMTSPPAARDGRKDAVTLTKRASDKTVYGRKSATALRRNNSKADCSSENHNFAKSFLSPGEQEHEQLCRRILQLISKVRETFARIVRTEDVLFEPKDRRQIPVFQQFGTSIGKLYLKFNEKCKRMSDIQSIENEVDWVHRWYVRIKNNPKTGNQLYQIDEARASLIGSSMDFKALGGSIVLLLSIVYETIPRNFEIDSDESVNYEPIEQSSKSKHGLTTTTSSSCNSGVQNGPISETTRHALNRNIQSLPTVYFPYPCHPYYFQYTQTYPFQYHPFSMHRTQQSNATNTGLIAFPSPEQAVVPNMQRQPTEIANFGDASLATTVAAPEL